MYICVYMHILPSSPPLFPYHSLNHIHPLLSYLVDCPSNIHHSILLHLLQNTVNGDECSSATHTSTVCVHVCVYVCVCVLKVFQLRRVAGNVSTALWVSEDKIIDFCLLFLPWRHLFVSDILYRAELVNIVFLADHQGSSLSGRCTNTGFGSFKLPTCEWLQKGRSHSQMESSLV